ncbi:hypothetical protein [Sediminibacterium soli]|uniref:hypothetical protein n=1 Tax=Sediminibacterium soli TaxID=2698829 RepID=UPI00137A147F|nr:hypothetical protein [Sediminibacterium soli]NCI46756.1 hypothetical protein [Sediminibacterium soli]
MTVIPISHSITDNTGIAGVRYLADKFHCTEELAMYFFIECDYSFCLASELLQRYQAEMRNPAHRKRQTPFSFIKSRPLRRL